MGDFFHGGRRKIGIVTLMMACVLTVGWVRSLCLKDEVCILSFRYGFGDKIDPLSYWIHSTQSTIRLSRQDHHVRWSNPGFTTLKNETDQFQFHYVFAVLPLTTMSAWLLLRQPRKSTPEATIP